MLIEDSVSNKHPSMKEMLKVYSTKLVEEIEIVLTAVSLRAHFSSIML